MQRKAAAASTPSGAPPEPMFHTLDPHNLDFKQDHLGSHHPQYYGNDFPGEGLGDNEDKMNLIDGDAASSAKVVGRDTRNARN